MTRHHPVDALWTSDVGAARRVVRERRRPRRADVLAELDRLATDEKRLGRLRPRDWAELARALRRSTRERGMV